MWTHIFVFCTLTKASITNKEIFLTMQGTSIEKKTIVLMIREKDTCNRNEHG
jgi:hypothetical protein